MCPIDAFDINTFHILRRDVQIATSSELVLDSCNCDIDCSTHDPPTKTK